MKQNVKEATQEQLKEKWNEKEMHGQYPKRLEEGDVDFHRSNKWLKMAGLKSETEGLIFAAQDQAIKTKYSGPCVIQLPWGRGTTVL